MRICFAAFLLIAMAVAGCCTLRSAHDGVDEARKKMEPALRAQLDEAQEGALLGILLELSEPQESHEAQLTADGLQIQARTGIVVVARGSRDSIVRAARRPFVLRLELSQERPGSHH